MAKAYKELRKPGSRELKVKLYCSSCEEWDEIDGEDSEWTVHAAYEHRYSSRWEFYDNDLDFIFGEECAEIEVWEHSCGEWFRSPERDETGDKDVWVCGECGHRTYDKERARQCCT